MSTASESGSEIKRILLVCRTPNLSESVREFLGAGIEIVETGAVPDLDAADRFDAALIEADLEDESSRAMIGRLALDGQIPVFVIGSESQQDLADQAYAQGASDFTFGSHLGRDFGARVRHSLHRRPANRISQDPPARPPRLKLIPQGRMCEVDGRRIHLTRHERQFLSGLAQAPQNFCTYRELIDNVWGPGSKIETQYVRVLVSQVRRKIEQPGQPPLVRTVPGDGYRLDL